MKKMLLFAAVLLPRIYFLDMEVQKDLGIDGKDLSKYELCYTDSMDLVTTGDANNIVLVAERCE